MTAISTASAAIRPVPTADNGPRPRADFQSKPYKVEASDDAVVRRPRPVPAQILPSVTYSRPKPVPAADEAFIKASSNSAIKRYPQPLPAQIVPQPAADLQQVKPVPVAGGVREPKPVPAQIVPSATASRPTPDSASDRLISDPASDSI